MRQFMILCLLLVAAPLTAQALEVGDNAPCVVLEQIAQDGSESSFCIQEADQKATSQLKVLEFFSTTCPACDESLPIVSALATEFKGQVTFRQVALDRDAQKIRDHVIAKKHLIHFDVAIDSQRVASKAFAIRYTPTLFVLDGNNDILVKIIGVMTPDQVNDLRKLFAGSN